MRYFIIILLCFAAPIANGQLAKGSVSDAVTSEKINAVVVMNRSTAAFATTSKGGTFAIAAKPGDVLVFSHVAYESFQQIVSVDNIDNMQLKLVPVSYKLQQVIISGRTKYQTDSAERHEFFSHELNKQVIQPVRFTGLGCSGCISWLADKITGNSKRPKKFRADFVADDRQLYIDSRYNEDIVRLLTDIKDKDSIAAFIIKYPMPYDFARAATDLELKAWIREKYREERSLHRR
ncbi:MAG: hypothetical protein IAE95_00690 [Chitinophagaceae bacterium]|nr:hypothetical protein [Chitinophagaceae bacterium]